MGLPKSQSHDTRSTFYYNLTSFPVVKSDAIIEQMRPHIPLPIPLVRPPYRSFHASPLLWCQKNPLPPRDDYYALLLSSPLPNPASTTVTTTTPEPQTSPSPSPSSSSQKPRILFGSRLAGPAAREREGWGGERPQEPDNCCMSGCVNCVWDAYREEVEAWAATRGKAEEGRLANGGRSCLQGYLWGFGSLWQRKRN